MRTLLPVVLLLSLPMATLANSDAPARPQPLADPGAHWTANFYLDNDLFTNTDQDYTNGIKASWISPDLQNYVDDPQLPAWVRNINQQLTLLHGNKPGEQRNLVISLAQTMYTPGDRYATDIIANDRPYAGWLYMGLAYQRRHDNLLDIAELNLGIVGPAALAKESQDIVHDLRGIERFDGWHNQLHNEPGINLHLTRKARLFRYGLGGRYSHDLIGHAGVSLGNVLTQASTGFEYRIGYRLPSDFGSSSIRPAGDNSAPGERWDSRILDKGWGWHLFVSAEGRLVARNIFLDGNTFRDSHSVDKEHIVGDISAGLALNYGSLKLTFSRVMRSREFKTQGNAHSYGSLALSYTY